MRFGDLWLPGHLMPDDMSDDEEECGVVIGSRLNDSRWAQQLIRLRNIHDDPTTHYHMCVSPIVAKQTIAIWHTHLNGNPWPSVADMQESERLGLPGIIFTPDFLCCAYNGLHVFDPVEY